MQWVAQGGFAIMECSLALGYGSLSGWAPRPSADGQRIDIPPGVGRFCCLTDLAAWLGALVRMLMSPSLLPGLSPVQSCKCELSLPCWLCAGIWARGDR